MTVIDQSLLAGKTRNKPIGKELYELLERAGRAAGVDEIFVYSGSQPGTHGKRTGSTRHENGRAADLFLMDGSKKLSFSDKSAQPKVKKFITACAALGANGIGAAVGYMGKHNIHVGFGRHVNDHQKLVWGAKGRSANAPKWLRDAANEGWFNPPAWVFETDSNFPEDLPEEEDRIIDGIPDSGTDWTPPAILSVPDKFNEDVIRGAQTSQRVWGIPASITLAQWALESGYGGSMPEGSNNPFGIKANPGEPSVLAWTKEYENGQWVRRKEPFRVFPDMGAAFIQHAALLATSGHYENARRHVRSPDQFADALTHVYATDPNYGSKLKSIMSSNNLYRFDLAAELSGKFAEIHKDESRVMQLQRMLKNLGFDPGGIDGKFGTRTASAVSAFQRSKGLTATGVFDTDTLVALGVQAPAPTVPGEPDVVVAGQDITVTSILIALLKILESKNGKPVMPTQTNTESELVRRVLEQLGLAKKVEQEVVGPVNGWLGQPLGRLLNGRKTAIGVIGLLGSVLLPGLFPSTFGPLVELFSMAGGSADTAADAIAKAAADAAAKASAGADAATKAAADAVAKAAADAAAAAVGTATNTPATPTGMGGQTVLQWIFGLITTWGVAGKIEKSGQRNN